MRYLILIAVAALAACSNSPKPDETRSEPPSRPVIAETKAVAPADTRHRLVAFGDSLTAGYGAPAGSSYPDYLQKLIDAKNLPWHVINAGISGDTTTDGLARLPTVLEYKPEIVILELGANDGLRGIPVESTRQNLQQIIAALKNSGATVVLAGMTLPPNYGPDYIRPFERVFTGLAKRENLPLIPFLLAGVGGHADLMQQDGLHPTAEGNRIVGQNVMTVVEPRLRK